MARGTDSVPLSHSGTELSLSSPPLWKRVTLFNQTMPTVLKNDRVTQYVKTMTQSKVKTSQSKVKTSDLNAQSTLAAGGPSTDHCALTDKKSLIEMVTK